jgi:outer membrane protein assembly factor BamA
MLIRSFSLTILLFTVVGSIMAGRSDISISKKDSVLIINSITLSGNNITKDRIILRELEFKVNIKLTSTILDSLIKKSQQNLMNRSLFNFVTISKTIKDNYCDIAVVVIERWYVWPIPILQFADRNINAWWEKQDFSRFNYGVDLRIENFRGLMERLNIILQFGYDVKLGLKWSIPYLTKNQIFGMGLGGGLQLNHSVAYETIDNKEKYYNSPSGYAQKNYYGRVSFTFRPKFNYQHGFSIDFDQFIFQDTILMLNPEFASRQTTYNYFTLNYSFKLDYRDYKPYPLAGYYFDIGISKKGIGVFDSEVNDIAVNSSFDQFVKLYNRWYFAYNVGGQISNNKNRLPYFIESGLGYHPNNIRGYELYVVDGQQLATFRSNIKYEIIPRNTFNISWIKSTKFSEVFFAMYANLFFDMAYVNDKYTHEVNPLSNQLLWGTGIGIDMISYYDIVLRLELSINKQKEKGFYISFVAPI